MLATTRSPSAWRKPLPGRRLSSQPRPTIRPSTSSRARNAPPRPGLWGACAPICTGVAGWRVSGTARAGALVVATTDEKSAAAASVAVSPAASAPVDPVASDAAAAAVPASRAMTSAAVSAGVSALVRAAAGVAATATGRAWVTITAVSGSARWG